MIGSTVETVMIVVGQVRALIVPISSGNHVICDFSSVEGNRLEQAGSQGLNYEQIGYNLMVSRSMETVMLMNIVYGVSLFGDSQINRV